MNDDRYGKWISIRDVMSYHGTLLITMKVTFCILIFEPSERKKDKDIDTYVYFWMAILITIDEKLIENVWHYQMLS